MRLYEKLGYELEWMASFPRRVWEEGPNGWTSREPTDEDRQRRKGFALKFRQTKKG